MFGNMENANVAYILEKRKRKPNFFNPIINMGILRIRRMVPICNGINRLIIIEIPVNPPGTTLLGSRNKVTPTP